jgi:hypothetical protein
VYDVSPRYSGRRFRDIPQIGVAPAVHLERARERVPLRTRLPLHSTRPAIETDWNFYWRRTVLRTTARQDFSRTQVVCINSKTGRKGGGFGRGCRGRISDEKTSKWTFKRHFLRSCQKFKKIRKTFPQE